MLPRANLLNLLALLAGLLLAGGVDWAGEALRQRAASTLIIGPRLWMMYGLALLFAAGMLAFAWLALVRTRPSSWVYVVFLLLGLAGFFYLPVRFLGVEVLEPLFRHPLLMRWMSFSLSSRLNLQFAVLLLVGLAGLLRKQRNL